MVSVDPIPEKRLDYAVFSVSELNRTARQLLEESFPLLWVRGEISNFRPYESGHWYFSLKDEQAQVRCVMFRHKNQLLDWAPKEGMQVEARALVSLYEARGEFQLNVEFLRRAGLGALYEAFERLKARLAKEGLFAPERKRPLPAFPRAIGIVTSPQAAALRDVLTTLARRMPSIPVIVYPAPVQGEGAAEKIADALRRAGERGEVDVLILCRGGGSIEDLWAFNEEAVARAVAGSPIPVVAGVGHETDTTIVDFVADRRAPTPTGAAELASPNRADLLHRLGSLEARAARALNRGIEARMQHLDLFSRRLVHPGERLANQARHLDHLAQRLRGAWQRGAAERQWGLRAAARQFWASRPVPSLLAARPRELAERLAIAGRRLGEDRTRALVRLDAHLSHLNPQAVLERGYSIARRGDGALVRDGAALAIGERLDLAFAHGSARVDVRERR
jgi:exodeoxyribonuclease VII large subunit